jgi:signal transduction histidine kinase
MLYIFSFITVAAMFAGIFILLGHGDTSEALIVGVSILPILAATLFIRWKKYEWAVRFIAMLMILMITVLSTRGLGIHALSNLGFPAILIVASLVSKRRTMIFLAFLTVVCVAWLVFGELAGLYTPGTLVRSVPGDFFTAAMTISAAALMVRLLAESMYETNRRLQLELQERRKAEARLKELVGELETKNAEMESFTDAASRDLKIPLAEIRRLLRSLEEDVTKGDRARLKENVEKAVRAGERMRGLLDDLLFLSYIGRSRNPSVDLPFGEVVHEALGTVDSLRTAGVEIVVAQDLPVIHGDRPRLVEVVRNLIDYATRATDGPPDRRIEIGQEGQDMDGNPVFFVRDTGHEIAPEEQRRIFGLIYREEEQESSSGVDLAVVKKIIEVHGGRIWVESSPGKGSTFFFTLPLAGN